MSNLIFDLLNIVATFSMFLCLLGEIVSYLFYSKRPTMKVNWWIHLKRISPQGTKRRAKKRDSIRSGVFFVNFAEFLRKTFLRTVRVAASEDVQDETKLLHMTSWLNKHYSFWIILATRRNEHVVTFFYSRMLKWKVKIKQTMKKSFFVFFFKRASSRAVQSPEVYPLRHDTDISQNYISLSHPHYIHRTKYTQKMNKPMIDVMVGIEADMIIHKRADIIHKCINA